MKPSRVEIRSKQQLLRVARPLLFDAAAEARRAAEEVGPLTCKAGCAACCYAKILCDVMDGSVIYTYLVSERRWTAGLREKLAAADRALTDSTHDHWFSRKKPCVFLREESPNRGRCTIYPVRPPQCSMTFSVSGDPNLCADVYGTDGQIQVSVNNDPNLRNYELLSLVMNRQVFGDDKLWSMTMPGAVLVAAAFFEKRPLPDVRRIAMAELVKSRLDKAASDGREFGVEDMISSADAFDAVATQRLASDRQPEPPDPVPLEPAWPTHDDACFCAECMEIATQ